MNSLTYLEWMKHLPKDDGSYSSCECPACGKDFLINTLVSIMVILAGRLFGAETCKSGVKISRTKIPEGASRLIDFQEQERFFETKPELKLIV